MVVGCLPDVNKLLLWGLTPAAQSSSGPLPPAVPSRPFLPIGASCSDGVTAAAASANGLSDFEYTLFLDGESCCCKSKWTLCLFPSRLRRSTAPEGACPDCLTAVAPPSNGLLDFEQTVSVTTTAAGVPLQFEWSPHLLPYRSRSFFLLVYKRLSSFLLLQSFSSFLPHRSPFGAHQFHSQQLQIGSRNALG